MPYEIITIPFNETTKIFHTDELNKFCLNIKIVSNKIEFFQDGKYLHPELFPHKPCKYKFDLYV